MIQAGIAWLLISSTTSFVNADFPLLNTVSTALTNARIYTVDKSKPWAEAVLIDADGFFIAVGSNSEIKAASDSSTLLFDLQGRLVLPGFQDAHVHAVEAGINQELCYIDPDADITEVPLYFEDCPNGGLFADQGWIVGAGIDVGILRDFIDLDPTFSVVSVLDEFYPDTPVLILDNLGHGALANSVAMSLVGYDQLVGDPPGGIIIRNPVTTEFLGIVLENAQQKLRDAAFPPTDTNREKAYQSLLGALDILAENGITTVSDAGGFYRQAQTESWARAESEEMLTVRASNALYIYPDVPLEDQLAELTTRFSNNKNALVRFNQAKIYVDGILGLGTGAIYESYSFGVGEFGFEYFTDNTTLFNFCSTLSDLGFQLHLHVTGDRGAALALDAIERSNPAPGPHRLTHCYLVDEADRVRFVELDAVADFQLAPGSLDPDYTALIEFLTSTELAATLLPALEVFNTGATVVLTSDWDADVLSPLTKIQTALSRPDGRSIASIEDVIPLMTINPAKLLHHDDLTGSIEVGKAADLVVLDKNIFDIAVSDIASSKVLVTMLQGETIYDPQGLLGEPKSPQTSGVAGLHGLHGSIGAIVSAGVVALYWLGLF